MRDPASPRPLECLRRAGDGVLALTIGQNLSDEARRSLGHRLGAAALGRL